MHGLNWNEVRWGTFWADRGEQGKFQMSRITLELLLQTGCADPQVSSAAADETWGTPIPRNYPVKYGQRVG